MSQRRQDKKRKRSTFSKNKKTEQLIKKRHIAKKVEEMVNKTYSDANRTFTGRFDVMWSCSSDIPKSYKRFSYNWFNLRLQMIFRPEEMVTPYFATFNRVKALGGFIVKDSKAFDVKYYSNDEEADFVRKKTIVRWFKVFNLDQTYGGQEYQTKIASIKNATPFRLTTAPTLKDLCIWNLNIICPEKLKIHFPQIKNIPVIPQDLQGWFWPHVTNAQADDCITSWGLRLIPGEAAIEGRALFSTCLSGVIQKYLTIMDVQRGEILGTIQQKASFPTASLYYINIFDLYVAYISRKKFTGEKRELVLELARYFVVSQLCSRVGLDGGDKALLSFKTKYTYTDAKSLNNFTAEAYTMANKWLNFIDANATKNTDLVHLTMETIEDVEML
jgi:N-terminal domain of anti-restriction factor ArdC